MHTNDILWKGIIESLTEDFLLFFYPDEAHLFDFSRPFDYLDKELAQIISAHETNIRHIDKLIKVWLKDGREHWMLVHIEVQGHRDMQFAARMFTYFRLIRERYHREVAALAIFTDPHPNYFPVTYQREHFGVTEIFRFRGYKVLAQEEEALLQSPNPFALVVLAVRTAIVRRKMDDESLWAVKFNLIRLLYERDYPRHRIEELFTFINQYVRFSSVEKSLNFAKHIESTFQPNNNNNMGIIEQAIAVAKEEGLEQGIEKGIEQGIEKGIEQGIEKGIEQGIEKGLQQGVRQGIEQNKIDVILKAHKAGLAIELISTLVDLSVKRVQSVLAEYSGR